MNNRQGTAEIELLPCPFCGEAAAWGEGEQKTRYGNEQVYCSNCYAMTAPEGSKEEAAFLWNDRNDPSAALQSERDALIAERDRLQDENQRYAKVLSDRMRGIEALEKCFDDLEAERDRLREALRNFLVAPSGQPICACESSNAVQAGLAPPCAYCVARAALSGKEGE